MSEIDRLIQQLKHEDSQIRVSAARALGKLGDKASLSALESPLNDSSVAVLRTATLAIGEIGGCETLDILSALLEHEELWVRKAAVQAMGRAGCQDAVPILVGILGDKSLDTLVRESLVALKVDPDFF